MPSALIVGASRGIGLGLARELAERGWRVVGTVRDLAGAGALQAVNAGAETLDVTDPAGPAALRAKLQGQAFGLVVLNAGILGPAHQSAAETTPEEAATLFLTNAVGPIRTARALLDLVPDGGVIAFVTSRMGSTSLNTNGDLELYRASKAALNSLTRSFAARLDRRMTVLSLHPGWVRTSMGGGDAQLDVPEAVRGMLDVIETRGHAGRSGFVDHAGAELAW